MNNDNKKAEEDTRTNVARAAAGQLATQALAAHLPPSAAVLAVAAGSVILPEVFRATVERAQRRVAYFVGECRAFYGRPSSPDSVGEAEVGVEAELLDTLNAPDTRDATLDALRAALDAVDDEAVPCITRLMQSYNARSAKPDGFFRAMASMLCGCHGEDFNDLRDAVAAAAHVTDGVHRAVVHAAMADPDRISPAEPSKVQPAPPLQVRRESKVYPPSANPHIESFEFSHDRAHAVVQRLATTGIGVPLTMVGAQGVTLAPEVISRLSYILGSPSRANR